jgi:hypothetical protein
MALSFSDAKQIPIPEYLSALGIEPAKIRGRNFWYRSPFRHEGTPSFKVDTRLNLWYDHGMGEGGTIIDLGAKLNQCTPSEFVKNHAENYSSLPRLPLQHPFLAPEEGKLTVISVDPIRDQGLLKYLRTRGIGEDLACQYCKEVTFDVRGKTYLAIGFPNIAGGYELRNSWFKGSSSPKDISYIDNDSDKLSVVEGFMDFLSVLQLKGSSPQFGRETDFLILNSLSFLHKQIPRLKERTTFLFLDNDGAGRFAKSTLAEKVSFVDCSGFYSAYKDVNEYLTGLKDRNEEPAIRKGLRCN